MMFAIAYCISEKHDLRLVGLAGAMCLLTAVTAVLMLRQCANAPRHGAIWKVAGALATAFGIWATHFIAMLGYDPGFLFGFDVGLSAVSLLLVAGAILTAFQLATRRSTNVTLVAAGLVAILGIGLMHYVGMAAIDMPARIRWHPGYVALSILCGAVLFVPGLILAVRRTTAWAGATAALLMTLAVVSLHFTGMTAIQLIPWAREGTGANLSPRSMSILLSVITVLLLAVCLCSALIARRTRAAIAASERQFSILAKGISDCALYMLDAQGRVANWNTGAARLKGYAEAEVIGSHLSRFYTPEDRARGAADAALATAAAEGKISGEGWRLRKDGSRFWAHVTIERMLDEDGRLLGFAKITRDMTQAKLDRDSVAEAQRHRDAALEHMHQGLCLFDAEERLILRNDRFLKLWHLGPDACPPGSSLTEVTRQALEARVGGPVTAARVAEGRSRILAALEDGGDPRIVAEYDADFVLSIDSRRLPDGGWVTTFEDISARRQSEARIAHMALHDALTGLPNRVQLYSWLDVEIARAAEGSVRLAVAAIDLDRFKEINDSLGHAEGDRVLVEIGRALQAALQGQEIAARVGGDEFVVAKRYDNPAELEGFVARLEGCLFSGFAAHGSMAVGASLGVAVFPSDAGDRETLLNNADLAMYRAKGDFAERICYYEPGMDEQARHRRVIANDLRFAAARGELRLLYQPQRSLQSNALVGFEALLRWAHPKLGGIPPMEFIPIAEETGEIIRLGEWVLRTACSEAAAWPDPHKVAVNLSPVQLLKPDLPEMVTAILVETGLAPTRLELEITETALIADKARALHSLRRIKALGVRVAMDDFGTGYSSLDTLHAFPFDKIKIDKSFLADSERSEQARAIIRAILALGRSLSIPVLAEGLETDAQRDLLLREGCAEAQGYLFGRPAAVELEASRGAC
ncbi:diguanylate cyclase (GGDEF)-like protein/PAS domain S-box-containing protein [Sphingomonas trueperi]|uniref:bifunctional diguanylate cyclase/phosphodiesterase n=1 Tax=Sphingomonas trueperi TaxID=53317 RepID=UPI00339A19E7